MDNEKDVQPEEQAADIAAETEASETPHTVSTESHRTIVLVAILVVIIILAFVVIVPHTSENGEDIQEPAPTAESEQIGADVAESLEQVQANPVDEVPDLNPTQNTNPFEDSYQNPFE